MNKGTLGVLVYWLLLGLAEYGGRYGGRPAASLEPTRWQDEDLLRLLDVPPSSR